MFVELNLSWTYLIVRLWRSIKTPSFRSRDGEWLEGDERREWGKRWNTEKGREERSHASQRTTRFDEWQSGKMKHSNSFTVKLGYDEHLVIRNTNISLVGSGHFYDNFSRLYKKQNPPEMWLFSDVYDVKNLKY